MADSKKYDGSQWEHSLRKLTTDTADIEPTIYSDGTAITAYTIKGNTVQSGTPTPSNPVDVQGVGERTENLFDVNGTYSLKSNSITITNNSITATLGGSATDRIYYTQTYTAGTYKISFDIRSCEGRLYSNKEFTGSAYNSYYDGYYRTITGVQTITFAEDFILGFILAGPSGANAVISNIMFQTSTSTKDYEPYGYKIPISSGGVTTPIYFSQPLMRINDSSDNILSTGTATRAIGKYEFTGQEYWLDNNVPIDNTYLYQVTITDMINVGNIVALDIVCTHFECGNYYGAGSEGVQHSFNRLYFRTAETTLENWKTWLANQYANGTPVTIWYILATPTTETVTAPSIPTTEGANSITVDTTVQPSEFTATWTGWHDASVKEYDGSDWQ